MRDLARRLGRAGGAVAGIRGDLTALRKESEELRRLLCEQSGSLRWLAEELVRRDASAPGSASERLISVIMPTWNRADVIADALRSVQAQTHARWECVIVDDGSDDDTEFRVRPFLADSRFRYLRQPHQNASAARNRGLAESRGDVVAYLDTDNVWYPTYLARIAEAYDRDASIDAAYTAQLVEAPEGAYVRCEPFDAKRLQDQNFIDLNVFSHRRALLERAGVFDESLPSLTDWDLIQRCAEQGRVARVPALGGVYRYGRPDQITTRQSGHYSRYRVREKLRARHPAPPRRLKVLYALWHYPQMSESYVRTELRAALAHGVEVEVWSSENVAVPHESEAPVHRGTPAAVVEAFRPNVIHVHWLNLVGEMLAGSAESGLPMTVRAHGFEFTPELALHLETLPRLRHLFLFPHQLAQCPTTRGKMVPLNAMFRPDLYYPGVPKDRRLVVRAGAGLMTKDLQTFFRTAQLCPQHHFLLILCQIYLKERVTDDIVRLNEEMGRPVEIRINLSHEEAAETIRRAGIYMHTAGSIDPFGMPVSIAESLGAGAYVLARRMREADAYLDGAGALYDTAEEAASLIQATQGWSDREWQQASLRAVDRAYSSFVNFDVAERIVDCWQRLADERRLA